MIRLLPIILIIILVLGGLAYWRFYAQKPIISPLQILQNEKPIEVPKTLPEASLEDRIKSLEDMVNKLVISPSPSSDLNSLDASVTELKARVSALESSTPVTTTSSKSTVYIPLGSGGQVQDQNWNTLPAFQISLDPAQYPGYTSMQFEVTMRLNQPGGTLYARLYNSSAGSATSSETSTTSTTATLVNSSTFTLPAGSKTYVLQAKTSDGTLGFLDYARIKVNF